MLKKLLILSTFIIIYSSVDAQFIPKRWAQIYSDSSKTVFIDTTSIRNREKQYIFWALEVLKEPVTIERIPSKIYRTKTQYVVNGLTDKYSIIGVLYYDRIGKLVGENYNRGLTGTGDVFSNKLSDNPFVEILLQKVKAFLDGEMNSKESKLPEEGTTELADKLKRNIPADNKTDSIGNADSIAQNKIDAYNKNKLAEEKPLKEESAKREKITVIPIPEKKRNHDAAFGTKNNRWRDILKLKKKTADSLTVVKSEQKEEPPKEIYIYNIKKERNATKTIFTDGVKYVVQVSSWRNKKIAETQKKKLIKLGYTAFITKVYIKKKRGTWYRVRIGYFDTLKEAKKIQREIRRKLK